MNKAPHLLVILLGVALIFACGRSDRESFGNTVTVAAGCYDGAIGPRSAAMDTVFAAVHLDTLIRVDTLEDVSGRRVVERSRRVLLYPRSEPYYIESYSYWRPIAHDSVLVSWSNGHNGEEYRLEVRDGALVGRGEYTWDVADRPLEAPPFVVSSLRVRCPA